MVATADNSFSRARMLFEAGELKQAETLCRRILETEPRNAAALDLLGLVAFRFGDFAAAVELVTKAITSSPHVANYHVHLPKPYLRVPHVQPKETR